jgi:hypothetical protein
MLKTARPGDRPRISELQVRRAADQLSRQYPQTPWLEAAHRADRAYAAGNMFHFRLWGRVTHSLREAA